MLKKILLVALISQNGIFCMTRFWPKKQIQKVTKKICIPKVGKRYYAKKANAIVFNCFIYSQKHYEEKKRAEKLTPFRWTGYALCLVSIPQIMSYEIDGLYCLLAGLGLVVWSKESSSLSLLEIRVSSAIDDAQVHLSKHKNCDIWVDDAEKIMCRLKKSKNDLEKMAREIDNPQEFDSLKGEVWSDINVLMQKISARIVAYEEAVKV